MEPTPGFLPREPHGQRSLMGYSPQVCKESDMTGVTACTHTCMYTHTHTHICKYMVFRNYEFLIHNITFISTDYML